MTNRLTLTIAAVLMSILTSCNAGDNNTEKNTADKGKANSNSSGEWQKISPMEIKNSIELFDKDWMALAVGKEGDMNAMTISWGEIGELWQKPVLTVFVSSSRYTHEFMERNSYFTLTAFPEDKRGALQYIGTHSGRDGDKLADADLTPEFTELGNPIFKEANLAIECRIIYKAPFMKDDIAPDVAKIYDNGMGVHTMYIGEIVNVWKK